NGPLIEGESGDNSLQGATVSQQGDDDDEQGAVLVQAVEGSALGGSEGLVATVAAKTLLLVGMDLDVATADVAPCRAVGFVTECLGGVHGVPPVRSRLASLPVRMFPGPPLDYPPLTLFTVLWGATRYDNGLRNRPAKKAS